MTQEDLGSAGPERAPRAERAVGDKLDVAFVRKAGEDLTLSVLGSFQFRAGDTAPPLPSGSQRLLALLALRDRSVTRLMIAGTLWPDSTEQHASASLRSALTRLRGEARAAVDVADLDLNLASGVVVDIRESKRFAHRLLEPDAPNLAPEATAAAVASLSADLLPDWYEDWVLIETAEWRQLRLHALEAMADHLAAEGRWAEAIGHGDPAFAEIEVADAFEFATKRMPQRTRWIISQRMAGVKMDEIGAELGISESRVSQILFEIRPELERVLVGQ